MFLNNKEIKMKILLFIFVFISFQAHAEIKEFTREYTYSASENDSKISARKAALVQLQSIVIQEVGVQVESSFSNTEALNGSDFSQKFEANYDTFSRALTKTKILKESWNGVEFYIKANITVDTDNLIDTIKTVYVHTGGDNSKPVDMCKVTTNKVNKLLNEVPTEAVLKELIDLSKSHGFSLTCEGWQYGIMKRFTADLYDNEEYRKHLFDTIYNIESDVMAGELIIPVMNYALVIKPLNPTEWTAIRDALMRSKGKNVYLVTRNLFSHTQSYEKLDSDDPRIVEREKRKQKRNELYDKIYRLQMDADIGEYNKITAQDLKFDELKNAFYYLPEVIDYKIWSDFDTLSEDQQIDLGKYFSEHYTDVFDHDSMNLIMNYALKTKITKKNGKQIYRAVLHAEKSNKIYYNMSGSLGPDSVAPFEYHAGAKLLSYFEDKAKEVIKHARTSQKDKDIWLIRAGFEGEKSCKLEECADMLFSKNRTEAENAADYLIAYGERAMPIKDKVIQKLERIKTLNKFTKDARLMPKLFQLASSLDRKNKEVHKLLIWSLGDADKRIRESASNYLKETSYHSFFTMQSEFESQTPSIQKRMIEVMGEFVYHKSDIERYLKRLEPGTPEMKFAIEDAIMALNSQ